MVRLIANRMVLALLDSRARALDAGSARWLRWAYPRDALRLLRFTVAAAAAAALALALGGALPTAANAASDASAANRTTFEDSRGEAANAPDITNVVVSNTDAGRITFTINGLPRLVDGMLVGIDIDSDNNPATGTQDPLSMGADYAIELVPGTANLFRWDGTSFTRDDLKSTTITDPAAVDARLLGDGARGLDQRSRARQHDPFQLRRDRRDRDRQRLTGQSRLHERAVRRCAGHRPWFLELQRSGRSPAVAREDLLTQPTASAGRPGADGATRRRAERHRSGRQRGAGRVQRRGRRPAHRRRRPFRRSRGALYLAGPRQCSRGADQRLDCRRLRGATRHQELLCHSRLGVAGSSRLA